MEITEETQPDWGKDLVGKTFAAKPDNLESDPQSLCGESRADSLVVCVCVCVCVGERERERERERECSRELLLRSIPRTTLGKNNTQNIREQDILISQRNTHFWSYNIQT